MIIYVDVKTLALTTAGHVPLTDMTLVRGDKIPLRMVLTDGPGNPSNFEEVPVLAVKKSLGDDALVLAATGMERVEDALGAAYVGNLSVNTVQLAEVMGDQNRIDLIGEVVLVAPDGAQRTSRLIRVTVRADLLPGDYAPPDEVLADWSELVASALAAQLPDALKDAGVELEASTGQSTLSSGDAADTWTIVGGYAFTWGDEILAGHLPDSCRLKSISTVYFFDDPATNQYCLRVWRLTDGAYNLIGTSAYVSNLTSGQKSTWVFTPGVSLTRGDKIIIQVCEGTAMTPCALGMHSVLTPSVPGRGLVTEVANPSAVDGAMAPLMTVVVDYDDGVTLGGIELATARQLDSLGRDVRQSSAVAEAAARTAGQSAATASTSANNAATSATNAAASATAAQQALEAMPQVDAAGNMTLSGGLTVVGVINANGGVRVPEPSTAQEALSYDSLLEQQARREWNLVKKASYAAVPCWVSALVNMQTVGSYRHHTPNASVQQGVILNNDLYDHLVQMTPASGVSLLGLGTPPWRFSELLGDYRSAEFAAASAWGISGGDDVSLMLGSPTQGYSATTDVSAPCYAHPIHWVNFNRDGMDYRYPLLNTVNQYTGRDMAPAWQVTTYGRSYLGSTASCLIRGTDYGRDVGDQQYIWGLVPGMTYLAVAMAPRQPGDHKNEQNRWELFVDGKYVMPMTSLFCGTGHTACVTATVKAHEVGRTLRTGLRMAGMRVDTGHLPGSAAAREILGAVVMDGATVKPVPEVEASALEVPAEGGEVRLTASSALSEAIYVLNDTMNGHDLAAVWCTQSVEEIPAGSGQVTLTLAANTTGQPRQVWAFVGHHYAQSAVIKINQLA